MSDVVNGVCNLKGVQDKMIKSLEHFNKNLSSLTVGAAKSDLLDSISINIHDQLLPIKHVATISVIDTFSLSVIAFDKNNIKAILKSIEEGNMNINAIQDGNMIRVILPKITQERRVEMCKLAKKICEDSKISVRNIRRDVFTDIKKNIKSEDEKKKSEVAVDKLVNDIISEIDKLLINKEKSLMQI